MVFEQLAQAVLSFVNWGITIVVIMLIWEIIQLIRGGTEERGESKSKLTDWESSPVLNKLGWTKKAKKEEKVRRAASRQETAELNEYIEEKEELALIKEAQGKLNNFQAVVGGAISTHSIPREKFADAYKALTDAVEEARKETDKLKRVTFRQERRTSQLIKELDGADVKDKVLSELRAMENSILKKHDEVIKEINAASVLLKDSGAIGKRVQAITKSKAATISITAGAQLDQSIRYIAGALDNTIKANLEAAAKAQGEKGGAYELTEGLIAGFRKEWK